MLCLTVAVYATESEDTFDCQWSWKRYKETPNSQEGKDLFKRLVEKGYVPALISEKRRTVKWLSQAITKVSSEKKNAQALIEKGGVVDFGKLQEIAGRLGELHSNYAEARHDFDEMNKELSKRWKDSHKEGCGHLAFYKAPRLDVFLDDSDVYHTPKANTHSL